MSIFLFACFHAHVSMSISLYISMSIFPCLFPCQYFLVHVHVHVHVHALVLVHVIFPCLHVSMSMSLSMSMPMFMSMQAKYCTVLTFWISFYVVPVAHTGFREVFSQNSAEVWFNFENIPTSAEFWKSTFVDTLVFNFPLGAEKNQISRVLQALLYYGAYITEVWS